MAEVARVLQVSPGTVKSRLFRSRALLREAIAELAASSQLAQSATAGLTTWIASLDAAKERAAAPRGDG